jgi:predicted Fe-S protein YdhL (DUF1289 family)
MAKQSHYNLPENNFTYGQPLKRDREGAQLGNYLFLYLPAQWLPTGPSTTKPETRRRNATSRNSTKRRSNKGPSVPKSLFYIQTQQKFRTQNDARFPLTKGKAFIDYTLPDEEFRYGRANRPPTPINYVMGTNNFSPFNCPNHNLCNIYNKEICMGCKVRCSWSSLINNENKKYFFLFFREVNPEKRYSKSNRPKLINSADRLI